MSPTTSEVQPKCQGKGEEIQKQGLSCKPAHQLSLSYFISFHFISSHFIYAFYPASFSPYSPSLPSCSTPRHSFNSDNRCLRCIISLAVLFMNLRPTRFPKYLTAILYQPFPAIMMPCHLATDNIIHHCFLMTSVPESKPILRNRFWYWGDHTAQARKIFIPDLSDSACLNSGMPLTLSFQGRHKVNR